MMIGAASNTKSSLHVVHRHGPCSSQSSKKATTSSDHDDILRLDQARVKSIHSKLSKKLTARDRVSQSQSTDPPARNQYITGSGNYILKVGIGTPKQNRSLVLDSGYDLTWTQCEPCGVSGTCYPQEEPIFNPSSSSTYTNVPCSSPLCDSLPSQGLNKYCSASNCFYNDTIYDDNSFTSGFFAKEKFTLDSEVFDSVNFGCVVNSDENFKSRAGFLGLGRGEISFPSQMAVKYNNIFFYCIPSSREYGGYLTFGSRGLSNSVSPDLEIPLTVFSTAGTIIDLNTEFTRLPPKAYAALRTAFMEDMSEANYTITVGRSILDTCYTLPSLENVRLPTILFSFGGGTVVELDPVGMLYVFDVSQACFPFVGNDNDDDIAIFGNVQQRTMQIVYDGLGGRVGFAPNGCM
ncbi:hypothetical protein HID58_011579 [Brassica napus]|uniref:Peptidase A1 domain-containing protein n=1 Tax=Brassica napus TaxID=3708 RepID=A0ABQ8DZ63_BRANA|nr:hypothetical protein HID58_011579 [Brassica napus]